MYKKEYHSLKKKSEREISEVKIKRTKNEDEQNEYPITIEGHIREKTLFEKIVNKEEEKFSVSNPISNDDNPRNYLPLEKEEKRIDSIKALGLSFKKIKTNEN